MSTALEMYSPGEELERVVLDGLDFASRCGYPETAEHTADVALQCRRCGTLQVLCRTHVDELRADFASQPRGIRAIECTACHAGSRDWDAIAVVVPL